LAAAKFLTALVVGAAGGAATALPAAAHPAEPVAAVPTAASAPGLDWPLVALVFAALALSLLMRSKGLRRAGAIVAVVELLAVGAQTGPHLVHHVLDPDQGARCAMLQAAQHGDGIAPEPPDIGFSPSASSTIETAPVPVPPARERSHRTRSPPA
jgi:hypothetical protein